ncbi:response regulator [Tenacibaculum maritimum]|uniref:LytR/AlgR family response regulator transcription factor n=1 Tax=Tenacibaculum maritimum TaxID=107401 RepID=UPI00132FBDAA|nr:response regulator [Tenacibaculum maritimum]
MRISCIIIDDEPLAVKVIKNHLQELRQIVVIGTFTNPIEALPVLEVEKVDVMFLDINMSRMNGLEFLSVKFHRIADEYHYQIQMQYFANSFLI